MVFIIIHLYGIYSDICERLTTASISHYLGVRDEARAGIVKRA